MGNGNMKEKRAGGERDGKEGRGENGNFGKEDGNRNREWEWVMRMKEIGSWKI